MRKTNRNQGSAHGAASPFNVEVPIPGRHPSHHTQAKGLAESRPDAPALGWGEKAGCTSSPAQPQLSPESGPLEQPCHELGPGAESASPGRAVHTASPFHQLLKIKVARKPSDCFSFYGRQFSSACGAVLCCKFISWRLQKSVTCVISH